MVKRLIEKCKKNHLTLATAESCTGGLVAATLTDIAGASEVFLGGIVSYSNDAKIKLLNVREQSLTSHGAVSEQVAFEMAQNAKQIFSSAYAISITGIAGPSGGSSQKPVGTVWFGLATPDGVKTQKKQFKNLGRDYVRQKSVQFALFWLAKELTQLLK